MVINNETILDKNECFKMLKKSNLTEYYRRFYLITVFAVFGLIIIIMGHSMNNLSYAVMRYIFTAMAVAYLVITLINIKRLPKLILKTNRDLCEYGLHYSYKFKEESVEISYKTLDKVSKSKYQYTDIKKIYEYLDLFLLVFKDTTYIYVKKEGFEDDKHMSLFKKNIQKIVGKPNKQRKIIMKNKKGTE